MKISKTALVVLGIGVFILAFAIIFVMYSGQNGEQEQLNNRLSSTQGLLPGLIAEKEDLADQLAQQQDELDKAKAALDKVEAQFPKSAESIEYDEELFKLAEQSGLLITELTASEPASEGVKGTDITYDIRTFTAVVQNADSAPANAADFELYIDQTVEKVLDFVHLVVTTPEFGVATVRLVALDDLDPPEEIENNKAEGPQATLELAIYGFPR
jgi:hypothetical protein